MKKFSDFSKETSNLEGEKIQIGEIFNKPIVVRGYRVFDSKCVQGKRCLQLQFEIGGETKIIFSNSLVLIRQIETYSEEIPFETVIKKVGSYHTFS